MDYYENEHGKDLRDFLMENSPKEWVTFCAINMLKYNVRAGHKEGESEQKEMIKFNDYLKDYCAINDITKCEAVEELNKAVEMFKKYE